MLNEISASTTLPTTYQHYNFSSASRRMEWEIKLADIKCKNRRLLTAKSWIKIYLAKLALPRLQILS